MNPKNQFLSLNSFNAGNQGLSGATVVPLALAPTTPPFVFAILFLKVYLYDIMNDRLLYHTSMTLPPQIPKSIQYHRSLQSTDIALNNLKKLNSRLDENNIVTLAYLANNPHINNEDREKYEKQMIHFLKVEQTRLEELKERITPLRSEATVGFQVYPKY